MDELHQKQQRLQECLRSMGRVLVAFSAGVDSTYLLKIAHDTLGPDAIAVTARACAFPSWESGEAAAFCQQEGIEQIVLDIDVLAVEGFAQNPPDRCYHCKRALFGRMLALAQARGIPHLIEGSNLDDLGDYRPGLRAIAELGVESPLRGAGLTKADIRALSRELGLPTADKPSFACLASRFVYGEAITKERLAMVERAERVLLDLGLRQMRVRVHGERHPIARIEAEPAAFPLLTARAADIDRTLRGLGFARVTLDLAGYRTGSMNRDLKKEAQP